jgi:DNA invertase Pin-like site-specific DNA recombinase
MSTERQCYSTQNQMDAIARYANSRGLVIVRTFADEGKSGLSLDGRAGLVSLLSAVQSGMADFKAVLVYDISRWGRFQDADESGYWEYVCKRAGVQIHYCAEPFINDGSMSSVILKSMKRTMAAEYSRELSVKVFAGQCRLVELGYHQGGRSGFGLRRLLIDQENRPKGILTKGAYKCLQTDRVVLVPGPEEEQQIVLQIYLAFVEEGKTQTEIANDLNARRIASASNGPWNYGLVHEILINPKYIGSNVYNRTSIKLRQRLILNPERLWVRKDGAFLPVVPADLFFKANRVLESRNHRQSDEEMLNKLRSLLAKHGRLSGKLIDREPGMLTQGVYADRFGGLRRAYERVGYIPRCSLSYADIRGGVKAKRAQFLNEFVSRLEIIGASAVIDSKAAILKVNGDFAARLIVCQCSTDRERRRRWWVPRAAAMNCDLTIVARMNTDNTCFLDYYVFPKRPCLPKLPYLRRVNSLSLDVYRFENLDQVYQAFRRKQVGDFI